MRSGAHFLRASISVFASGFVSPPPCRFLFRLFLLYLPTYCVIKMAYNYTPEFVLNSPSLPSGVRIRLVGFAQRILHPYITDAVSGGFR